MTSRRGFLAALAAAVVLDPERMLWVPGAKKIFIPPLLWVPDCSTCKHNVKTYRARDLRRHDFGDFPFTTMPITGSHLLAPNEMVTRGGILLPKWE